jgi:hypothetical protein
METLVCLKIGLIKQKPFTRKERRVDVLDPDPSCRTYHNVAMRTICGTRQSHLDD